MSISQPIHITSYKPSESLLVTYSIHQSLQLASTIRLTTMDPMSITGTVLAIVHITGICLKSGNQHLGPSRYTSTTLLSLIQELYCFYGAIQSLKTHLTINEHDTIRLNSLDCLTGPLSDCKLALCLVEKQLKDDTFFKRKLIGKHCDKKLDDAINVLKKGRGLFETVLLADQR
jgi:hypothetical protein